MCPVWTPQQEDFLRQVVEREEQKPINWIKVAQKLNERFQSKTRSGKQCRQKYTNKARFAKTQQPMRKWTNDDAVTLIEKVSEYGSRWSKILAYFPNRSQNSLKNKFYGELRKTIRNINKIGKDNIKGFSKTIKYQSLIRVMQGSEGVLSFKGQLKQQCERLKDQILKLMKNNNNTEEVIDFIKEIHQFNMTTRCYCAKKAKRSKHNTESQIRKQISEQPSAKSICASFQLPGHASEPIKLTREKIKPLEDFFQLNNDVGRKIYSENGIENLDEQVSNILGYEYTPMGFSYFEEN